MPNDTDFWAPDFAATAVTTPKVILQQQAALLSQKTGDVLQGQVTVTPPQPPSSDFAVVFELYLPSLDYRYKLLNIEHPVSLYPLKMWSMSPDIGTEYWDCPSEAVFKESLRQILSGPETTKLVSAMIAQTQDYVPS